jgi:hypothetical protein
VRQSVVEGTCPTSRGRVVRSGHCRQGASTGGVEPAAQATASSRLTQDCRSLLLRAALG